MRRIGIQPDGSGGESTDETSAPRVGPDPGTGRDGDTTRVPGGRPIARPAATDRLANERTYLAWLRTGLACFALCIGIGAVLPELTRGEAWPFVLIGAGFGLLGVWLVGYAHLRRDSVERALEHGHGVPSNRTQMAALGLVAALLGLSMVVVIVVLELR